MSGDTPLERMYTIAEVENILRVSERTVHRYLTEGKLHSYKPGKKHLIPESSIRAMLGIRHSG